MSEGTLVGHSRLHFGLVDVGHATRRRYGGVGLMVRDPATVVRWRRTDGALTIRVEDHVNGRDELLCDAERAVRRLSDHVGLLTGSLVVIDAPEPHVGHGSKTSGLLTILAAAMVANTMAMDRNALVQASGRGGTSGVGVHGFFTGGVVVDAGHPQSSLPIGPSSSQAPTQPPLLLSHVPPSPSWVVALLRPRSGEQIDGTRERDFFRRNTPVPRSEAHAALAAVHHAIVPGVVSHDLPLVGDGLRDLTSTGFKRREVAAQPRPVQGLLEALQALPAVAAGMSSLGPLLFALVNEDDAVSREQVAAHARNADTAVTWTVPSTCGHEVVGESA